MNGGRGGGEGSVKNYYAWLLGGVCVGCSGSKGQPRNRGYISASLYIRRKTNTNHRDS